MKTRLTLVLGVVIVGLLLAYAGVAKAAEGDLTYTGVLTKIVTEPISNTVTAWFISPYTFAVDSATVIPPFYKLNDTIVTMYTEVSPSVFLSKEFKVLNSGVGNTYTYSGTLTTVMTDTTSVQWTVGKYTFTVPVGILPPYYKVNDKVEVTFHIEDGKFVVNSVQVTETVVGTKVESSRCQNRTKDQPALYKLANEFTEDPQKITGYFCSGFGVGEIRLAFKIADKGYTAAMLLAMRAEGMSWGEIKQMVAKAKAPETTISPSSTVTNTTPGGTITKNNPGNSANHGKGNNGNGTGKTKPNQGKKP